MKPIKIKLNVRPWHKLPRGHQPHLSGSGTHTDRRLKRTKTRQRKLAIALCD